MREPTEREIDLVESGIISDPSILSEQAPQPRFVMYGWRDARGCHLALSDDVIDAQVTYPRQEHHDLTDLRQLRIVSRLEAHLHGRRVFHGPSWAECLAQAVFGPRQWRPDQENPPTESETT